MMQLFFAPLACSLATRIALYEANADASYIQVDTKLKTLLDGADFYAINPLGQVPVLRADDGTLISENTAILPFVADKFPAANLIPATSTQRAKLHQWLGFIGTELHKAVFIPLLDPHAPTEVKTYARDKTTLRMNYLESHLQDREFVMEHFTVADAYLTTVLNWAKYSGLELQQWPHVHGYYIRMLQRPKIAKALAEEVELYKQEMAHRAKAA